MTTKQPRTGIRIEDSHDNEFTFESIGFERAVSMESSSRNRMKVRALSAEAAASEDRTKLVESFLARALAHRNEITAEQIEGLGKAARNMLADSEPTRRGAAQYLRDLGAKVAGSTVASLIAKFLSGV